MLSKRPRPQRISTWFKAVRPSAAQPRRAATLRVAGASEGCRFAAAGPNNVRQGLTGDLRVLL